MTASAIILLFIAAFTLIAAVTAFVLRNIIRSAILLVPAWIGIGAFYLWAEAEFVAFAQVLVYVGAISMVVLFAVVLTRRAPDDPADEPATLRRINWSIGAGSVVAAILFAAVITTILPSSDSAALSGAASASASAGSITIKDIGHALIGEHAAAVLITGLLLTVALLGSILLAATDKPAGTIITLHHRS